MKHSSGGKLRGARRIRRPGRSAALAAFFALILPFAAAAALFGSSPSEILRHYEHDSWRVRDGLPSDDVEAIVRTRDGYLWLGSDEGLVRFDGVRFARLEELSKTPARTGSVRSLLAGRDGSLWIGTHNGVLYRWIGGALSVYGPSRGFGHGIRALCEGADGSLWVGTWGGGVFRLARGTSDSFTTANGLPANDVFAIRQGPDGSVWIATWAGLARWKAGALTSYAKRDGLPTDKVFSLGADPGGEPWIGAIGGLARWRDGRLEAFGASEGAPNAAFTAMAVEPDGMLWIGTKGGGLIRFSHGVFERGLSAGVLGSDIVLAMCRDGEGSIWVGTRGGGLHRFKPKVFTTYDQADGLPSNTVSAVLQDAAGDMWVGTRGNGSGDIGGLARLQNGTWTRYGMRQGLASNRVGSLFEDRQGTLWVGGAGGGLARVEKGRITRVFDSDGEPGNNGVLAIAQDREGAIWFGTGRGALYRLQGGKRTPILLSEDRRPGRILSLLSARDGSVWIGTGGGLYRWKDGRATADPGGLPHNPVLALYEDAGGILWLGTRGGGLGRRSRDGKVSFITSREGLCGDVIFQILEDSSQNLWLSGPAGVCRVPKADLESVALARTRAVRAIRYGAAAGIPNGSCSGAAQPAGWRDRAGRLWFTTDAGVIVVDPLALAPSAPASVRVESVLADQRPLDPAAARLEPGTRHLSIRYTSLSLLDPMRLRFRYRLEGFDREWVDAGGRRTAEYMNLPAGSYRFRVAVGNGDGVWNESGAGLTLTASPHFYQTPWFVTLCAAAVVGAAWGLHRIRLRQLRHQFNAVLAERARFARDVHDTLAQGFTAILLHLESVSATLSTAPEVARHHVDRVRQTARRSLVEARRSVWDLRRSASENGSLVAALADFAAEAKTRSPAVVEIRSRGPVRPISDDVEHELVRLAQEAVTNAMHHAGARAIRIGIIYHRDAIRLTVSDNGRGFEPSLEPASPGHFGLLGMRERTQRLRGRLTLRSRPGRGTVVSIRVPLDSEFHGLRRALRSTNPTGDRRHEQDAIHSHTAG